MFQVMLERARFLVDRFTHITSYPAAEQKAWPSADSVPQKVATAPAKDDDDDDMDLFGSDEEVDEEAERIREER